MTNAAVEKRRSAEENLVLVETPDQVDSINSSFYSRFPYPWQPQLFYFCTDRSLNTRLINQNLGDWQHGTIPKNPKVWVAGCGTNQAVYTALLYPDGEVIGSDLSPKSLEICSRTAKDLQLTNLTLRQESINGVDYKEQFDLVISTGVIHHNAEPERALRQLVRAMKPGAVLELMVYNRFHRLLCSAFQKAVRLLVSGNDNGMLQSDEELKVARNIMRSFGSKNLISSMLDRYKSSTEAEFADALIQPVEHSYTVETFNELGQSCGVEILSPVLNEHDQSSGTYSWQIEFKNDADLQKRFDAQPDLLRWQFANLLLLERSPMLWFYMQRKDSERRPLTQDQINQAFLDTVFDKVKSSRRFFLRQANGSYSLTPKVVPHPSGAPHPAVQKIFNAVDGKRTMREIMSGGKGLDFGSVLSARMHLTTSLFPFLVSAGKS
jgi:SAM-dependent methyltransferase